MDGALNRTSGEGFDELLWPAGTVQVDFGEAEAIIASDPSGPHIFLVTFPFSNMRFLQAYRGENAEDLGTWLKKNTSFRPPIQAERDAGITGTIAGHNVRVVEGMGILGDINSSSVRFTIDQAPGVYVEVGRETAMKPNVGLIQRLENQITRLPPGSEETGTGHRGNAAGLP